MSISKEDVFEILRGGGGGGVTMSRIATLVGGSAKGDREKVRALMAEMVEEGSAIKIGRRFGPGRMKRKRRGAEAPAAKQPAATSGPQAVGQIRVHPAGYGFVVREDGLGDVFVPAKYRGHALDGDRVLLYTWEGYKGTEGRVEDVLERGRAKLTGILRRGRSFYVEPDDPRLVTDFGHVAIEGDTAGARVGQCVVVEITRYPEGTQNRIVGRMLRVLGDPEDPNTEIEKIIAVDDIPTEFPEDAIVQAKRTPQEVDGADLVDRIDLRDREFFTIDPETARDFDDALCVETGPHGGPRVWIAVADVSHYVKLKDPLDREASVRGVSVYLPDRVIPMLPFELSSGICSLNPEVDRCAMVVRLDYSEDGDVVGRGFCAAVIRSRARLDYPGVAAALVGDFRGPRARYRPYIDSITKLAEIAGKLRRRRQGRGALELEIPEPKVVLDADDPKLVRDVVRAKADSGVKQAYQLVEEFMVAANEAIGRFFAERGLPTVWRVHPPPGEDRLTDLAEIMETFGVKVDVERSMTPHGVRDVLEQLVGLPCERALSFLVLRSLMQASYSTHNVGHFGLASEEYIHFTSPIRRYSDLLVHRLLKHYLHREGQAAGGQADVSPPAAKADLELLAKEISSHERRAIEAEREAVAMYRAYLMREHIGEEFSGRISGITSFGAFVEFDEPFIEGLIKLEALGDDRFEFDPLTMQLRGRRTGLEFRLGDHVEVEVLEASIVKRKVALRLTTLLTERKARPKKVSKGPASGTRGRGSSRSAQKKRNAVASRKKSSKKRRR